METEPYPLSCMFRMRMALSSSKREAERCDAIPIKFELLSRVRFKSEELDSTKCGGSDLPAAVSAS